MTREEAIRRIENHIRIHSKEEPFRACHIQEALKMAIDALKVQESKVMIDAELIEEIQKAPIVLKPNVDAVPVVHGRWIDENPDDPLDPRMRCSICAEVESPLLKWRYCPNCGAKMDEKGE